MRTRHLSVDKDNNSGEFRNKIVLNFFFTFSSCEKAILYGGIVAGAVLLILIVIAVVIFVLRRRGHGGGGDASERNNNKGSSKKVYFDYSLLNLIDQRNSCRTAE